MGKVKTELLTDYGCVVCDTLYPKARAALGYRTCTECGEVYVAEFDTTAPDELWGHVRRKEFPPVE